MAEGALVYVARHRNLMISVATLTLQVVLSFVFVIMLRDAGWPPQYQAVGPALALAVSLSIASVAKALLLGRMLGAGVSAIRPGLLAAMVAGGGVGVAISKLPEWTQLTFGVPLILIAYFLVLFRLAFGPEDKALFRRMPREQQALIDDVP